MALFKNAPKAFDEVSAEVGFRFDGDYLDQQDESMIRLLRGLLTREVFAEENPGETFPAPSARSIRDVGR